ncbi:MAG: exo-alpha-sialidase, partial [Armatimonadota bacterium]
LSGARFVRGSIDKTHTTVQTDGVVYVLTPRPERNDDSAELSLLRQGFERAAVGEFILFGGIGPNACTLFQKRCTAGETIEIGKWGVLVLPPE